MNREINTKNNKILYAIQQSLGWCIHRVIRLFYKVVPLKYKNKVELLEKSNTFNNVIGLAVFNALGGVILMLTNVKVANVLGASAFGLYSYYLAIGEVGQNFVRYGRNKTMTRDLIQRPENFNSLISNTFILGLLNILLFLAVVLLFSKPLDISISITTILLLLAPCLGSIDFQPVYEALKQMSWHSVYLLIQRLFFLIILWGLIIVNGTPTLFNLGGTLFLSWLLIVILQYREIISSFMINIFEEVSFKTIISLYKSNFLIALSCMTGVAFGPIIRMVLKDYADTQSVGIYSAGMQIFLLSQFLMHQVSRVGNPMMAEAGKQDVPVEKRRSLCNKYLLIMACAIIPFVIPLCVCPKLITRVCFTEEYAALGNYLPIYGIYLITLALGIVYTQFLISMRRDRTYFIIYIASAMATTLSAFVFIPFYGLLGAIISLCIPHSIGCFFYYICSLKYLK